MFSPWLDVPSALSLLFVPFQIHGRSRHPGGSSRALAVAGLLCVMKRELTPGKAACYFAKPRGIDTMGIRQARVVAKGQQHGFWVFMV